MKKLLTIASITYVLCLAGCNDGEDEPEVNCNAVNINIQANTTQTNCGESTGSIEVTATGGAEPYMFKLDNGQFQSTGNFTGLASGSYEIEVKDANDCMATTTVNLSSGISYQAEIKSIIDTNCAVSGCHVSGTGRPDFSSYSGVQNRASGIRSRTQAKTMPPSSSGLSLSDEEIQKIACWVNDGAPNN